MVHISGVLGPRSRSFKRRGPNRKPLPSRGRRRPDDWLRREGPKKEKRTKKQHKDKEQQHMNSKTQKEQRSSNKDKEQQNIKSKKHRNVFEMGRWGSRISTPSPPPKKKTKNKKIKKESEPDPRERAVSSRGSRPGNSGDLGKS